MPTPTAESAATSLDPTGAPQATPAPAAAPAHAPTAIGQIALHVEDVERAAAFYRDVLGLRFLFAAPPGLAFLDCGGVRLMLARPERPDEAPSRPVLYYRVDDVHAAHAAAVARGARDGGAPHRVARLADREVWMGFLHDGEGNLLALMSEPPLSPAG